MTEPSTPSDVVFFPENSQSLILLTQEQFKAQYGDYELLVVSIKDQVPVAGIKSDNLEELEAAFQKHSGLSDDAMQDYMVRPGPNVDLGEGARQDTRTQDQIRRAAGMRDIVFFPEKERVSLDALSDEERTQILGEFKHLIVQKQGRIVIAGTKQDDRRALQEAFEQHSSLAEVGVDDYYADFGPAMDDERAAGTDYHQQRAQQKTAEKRGRS